MSGQIRVTPAELLDVANKYRVESSNVEELVVRLDGMISHLQGIWEGASSQAFADQYQELRPSIERTGLLLAEVSEQLTKTSQALQDADQQIANQIRG